MNAEMTDYLRRKARSNAYVVVIILLVVAMITFLGNFTVKDDNDQDRNEFIYASLLIGPASILTSFVFLLSRKNLALVELYTPVMLISVALSLAFINIYEVAGQVTEKHR